MGKQAVPDSRLRFDSLSQRLGSTELTRVDVEPPRAGVHLLTPTARLVKRHTRRGDICHDRRLLQFRDIALRPPGNSGEFDEVYHTLSRCPVGRLSSAMPDRLQG